jgi:hypothetical protein
VVALWWDVGRESPATPGLNILHIPGDCSYDVPVIHYNGQDVLMIVFNACRVGA